jgi:predicted porin
MKKSLIALAVAGAFAAPAFAATSNVDVYGRLDVAIQDTNDTNYEMQVTDNVSRLGFKGTEDLGGGLKAIWQIESQLNPGGNDGLDGAGTVGGRNTFVGLAGGFGTFVMGRHDTPYKLGTASLDIFGDTIGDYNGRLGYVTSYANPAVPPVPPTITVTTVVDPIYGAHDARLGNAIAYISPTWDGFHFAAAVVAGNDAAAFDNNNKTFDAYSLTGVYANGPLFASLSYQDVVDAGAGAGNQSSKAWKVGLGYTFGDAKVGFVYEDVNNDTGGLNGGFDRSSWVINGVYNMGPIALKAQYGKIKDWTRQTGATTYTKSDPTKWDLGVDYALSKRTKAYVVYSGTNDDVAGTKNLHGYNIGLQHNF